MSGPGVGEAIAVVGVGMRGIAAGLQLVGVGQAVGVGVDDVGVQTVRRSRPSVSPSVSLSASAGLVPMVIS